MSKENGGPAFPVGFQKDDFISMKGGMTLRDYFAAKAMQGMLANTDSPDEALHRAGDLFRIVAANAYEMADAMLAERSKP